MTVIQIMVVFWVSTPCSA